MVQAMRGSLVSEDIAMLSSYGWFKTKPSRSQIAKATWTQQQVEFSILSEWSSKNLLAPAD
ncbi:hypothetical protein K239x_54680 [Planctomycetes bacterium K23_9]|uniref:Uncharacterized protein n=1 Tax=Stieleria marina TaxID=1930275 RepID=A0A517P254_9BACT|nr:hypothetical protein K239x_54680 [Planctomycetes bacterium K23_9]